MPERVRIPHRLSPFLPCSGAMLPGFCLRCGTTGFSSLSDHCIVTLQGVTDHVRNHPVTPPGLVAKSYVWGGQRVCTACLIGTVHVDAAIDDDEGVTFIQLGSAGTHCNALAIQLSQCHCSPHVLMGW